MSKYFSRLALGVFVPVTVFTLGFLAHTTTAKAAAVKNYTISFYATDGSGTMPAQVVAKGSKVKLLSNTFTKSGYYFNGWSKTVGGKLAYADGAYYPKISADVTLYALWEPAYTLMLAKKPSIRTIDLNIGKTWKEFAGGGTIPYLGVGAHTDWADANPDKVQKLYTIYKAAVEWVQKNPDEAAPLLAKGAPPEELKAVAAMIKSNERLAMKLTKAGDVKKDIQAVYKAGMEINYLPSMPSNASIYDKPLK